MRAGKLASLRLLPILTALGVLVTAATIFVEPIAVLEPLPRLGVAAGLFVVGLAVLLFPIGLAVDRSIARLRAAIDRVARGEDDVSACFRPAWLRPVTHAVTGVIDLARQREQALNNQLRDLDIRHRVSESERRQIEAVLHSLRDGVLVTDAFGEIVMANDAGAHVLGFDLEGAIHRKIDEMVDDATLCRLVDDARATANFNDRRHVEHELLVGRGDDDEGDRRVYDVSLTCVADHRQEVGGVVMILHDLTREREISQMKSDFVSKASHELRTPLSSIRAYVEMLVDGEAKDEAARVEFYQIIQSETDRLGRLIDNMLNISRIEAGIVQIEREMVDMKDIIHRALETLGPQAKEKKITLHHKLAPVDLTIEGDADMLFQVVLNLASNGVKYTPEGGRITVSADSDNLTRSVVVRVADTGLGIPPDSVPRLFDKFYRVKNYKRVAKGTGLGLNLCKHIVETVHRGQIGVESKLGMGSRFWFSVPMQYAGTKSAA